MTEEKKDSTKKKKEWLIPLLITLGGVFVIMSYLVIQVQADLRAYFSRGEGIVLASSAKNLVTDNAVNGFPFERGWESNHLPTKNTQAIEIDKETGKITIIHTVRYGGYIIALTPSDSNGALAPGRKPEGAIRWCCTLVDQGSASIQSIPAECRS